MRFFRLVSVSAGFTRGLSEPQTESAAISPLQDLQSRRTYCMCHILLLIKRDVTLQSFSCILLSVLVWDTAGNEKVQAWIKSEVIAKNIQKACSESVDWIRFEFLEWEIDLYYAIYVTGNETQRCKVKRALQILQNSSLTNILVALL